MEPPRQTEPPLSAGAEAEPPRRRARLLSPGWMASHLFVAATVVLMINLGFWQLGRHDDRRADNAAVAAAMSRDPVDVVGLLDADDPPPDYAAVTAAGRYVEGAEVLIANRSFEGQAGSWLATPLRLDPAPADGASGGVVMVVRGWVPRRHTAGIDERPAGPPPGPVTVTGLAFASVAGGRIGVTAPGQTPEISRPDLDRYREVTGLDAASVWIRLRAQDPPPGELPIPVPPPALSAGPHLSYAFQWFFFSAGAAAVYGLILRRSRRQPHGGNGPARRARVA